MKLYTLDDSTLTKGSAPRLMRDYKCDQAEPIYFNQENCFADLSEENLKTGLIFYGHRNADKIGEFDASGFISRFVLQFNKRFNNKKDQVLLTRIDLIDCIEQTAIKIANGLYDKGFKNITVHAIAGVSRVRVRESDIRAYQLQPNVENEVRELENSMLDEKVETQSVFQSKQWLLTKITNFENASGACLITSDINAEMQRPHNIFFPSQLKKVTPIKDPALEKAFLDIDMQRRELINSGSETKKAEAEKLQALQQLLKDETMNNGKNLIAKTIKEIGDIKKEKNGLKEKVTGIKEKVKDTVSKRFTKNLPNFTDKNIDKRKSTTRQILTDAISDLENIGLKNLPMPVGMVIAKEKIALFKAVLEQEEKNRRMQWINKFFPLKSYKIERLHALTQQLTAYYNTNKHDPEKLNNWISVIDKALADLRLIKGGIRGQRTKNLLLNIQAGIPERGVFDKKDPKVAWEWEPAASVDNIKKRITRWW